MVSQFDVRKPQAACGDLHDRSQMKREVHYVQKKQQQV